MGNITGGIITGGEKPILKIFTDEYKYSIPAYQRPYAWEDAQVEDLFNDLYDAWQRGDAAFFLGCIVLIKKNANSPECEVVDGQQRLTTLTILFAVLASKISDNKKVRDQIEGFINDPGNPIQGIEPHPRLRLREGDQPFFNKYIQQIDIQGLLSLDPASLKTDAQKRIRINAGILARKVSEKLSMSQKDLLEFIRFVTGNTILVVVTSSDENTALNVFSVLNSRGLNLQPTDILKAKILQIIPKSELETYTKKWEELEEMVGRDGFSVLFSNIRMIYLRKKQQRSLQEEFTEEIIKVPGFSPKQFITDVLEPYADAFKKITDCSYISSEKAEQINSYLKWLNKVNNMDWQPPAIKFLCQTPQPSSAQTEIFFKKLERLAAYMHLCEKNVNYRTARYAEIIAEIGKGGSGELPPSIELTAEEKNDWRTRLAGPIYEDMNSERRNYLLLRVDSFVSDKAATYNPSILTIEHVLPQTPSETWLKGWPDQTTRAFWTHRLANLVPLNKRRNSQASNYDFKTKKDKYFKGTSGVPTYSLTSWVLSVDEWTPGVVFDRQKELLRVLCEKWELPEIFLNPPNPGSKWPESVKAGIVARTMMPYAFENGLVTKADIDQLTDPVRSKMLLRLQRNECPFLKLFTGENDAFDDNGNGRYYTTIKLQFDGNSYLLTNDLYEENLPFLLEWLQNHGIPYETILKTCLNSDVEHDTPSSVLTGAIGIATMLTLAAV